MMRAWGRSAGVAAIVLTLGVLTLGGCAVPVGPVSVSRFHLPDTASLGHGAIAVVPAAGMDGGSLEVQSYQAAVTQQLGRLGYAVVFPADASQVAEVRLASETDQPAPGSPVHVGGAGYTGSYGSGLGLGLSFNLSGGPKAQTTQELGVVIRERATGTVLWEGKALFTVAATSPLATTQLAAPKLAGALFAGFPGHSGETIQVP